MYTDTRQWNRIRDRVLIFGESRSKVAKTEQVSRNTVRKILKYDFPPGYGGSNLKKPVPIRNEKKPRGPAPRRRTSLPVSKQQWMEWLYTLERQPSSFQGDLPSIEQLLKGLDSSSNSTASPSNAILT